MKKITLLCFLLAFGGVVNAKTVTRYVLDDGMTNTYRNPSAAVDKSGNVHVVAQGQLNDFSGPGDDIYYFRVSKSGAVKTPMLGITTGGTVHDNGRAHVVTLESGMAVVAWREHSPKVVKAVVVDPAANSGAGGIVAGPVTVMDASVNSPAHFDVAVDGAHVHFIISASNNVWHARLAAADLSEEVAAHATGLDSYWQDIKVAADSSGNLHVVGRRSSTQDPFYAELDTDGAPLIGPTFLHENPLSPGEGTNGNHLGVAVKSGKVLVMFGDKRDNYDFECQSCQYAGQGGSAFLTTIDPSAHSQGVGADGDIEELRVGSELRVGNIWYAQGFLGTDGAYHIMSGSSTRGSGDINYFKVKGTSISSAQVTANNASYSYYRKYISGAGNMVVWAEGVYAPTISGVTSRLVAAKTSSFIGSSGGGGSPAPMLLAVLGLVGLARARMRQ